MSAIGPKRTFASALHMSAFRGKADMRRYGCICRQRPWRTRFARLAQENERSSTGCVRKEMDIALRWRSAAALKGNLMQCGGYIATSNY